MKEILVAVKEIQDGNGILHRFSYYRLEDPEGYGVCVKSGQGGTAMVPGITTRRRRIDALLEKLFRFAVSPVCAPGCGGGLVGTVTLRAWRGPLERFVSFYCFSIENRL